MNQYKRERGRDMIGRETRERERERAEREVEIERDIEREDKM